MESQVLNSLSRATFSLGHFFDKFGYPDAPAHKKAHRDLVEKVLAFEAGLKSGRAKVTMEIMRFLKDWLVGHIMGTDKRYGPFLNSKGVR